MGRIWSHCLLYEENYFPKSNKIKLILILILLLDINWYCFFLTCFSNRLINFSSFSSNCLAWNRAWIKFCFTYVFSMYFNFSPGFVKVWNFHILGYLQFLVSFPHILVVMCLNDSFLITNSAIKDNCFFLV